MWLKIFYFKPVTLLSVNKVTSKWRQYSLLWQHKKRPKIGYFGPFQPNNLETTWWKFLFSMYFRSIGKKNIFTTSLKKSLHIGFRTTLKLCKNYISMNPMYRIFSNLAHVFIMFVSKKYIKFKNFHRPVLKLLASKGWEKGLFPASFDIAMVTNFDVKAT